MAGNSREQGDTGDQDKNGRPKGRIMRTGYYARNLDVLETALFDQLYSEFRAAYELDDFADDMLLCDLIRTHIMLNRNEPPPTPAKGKANVYDYSVSRQKLVLAISDALALNRKHRLKKEAEADIMDTLAGFFTGDARDFDSKKKSRTKDRGKGSDDAATLDLSDGAWRESMN